MTTLSTTDSTSSGAQAVASTATLGAGETASVSKNGVTYMQGAGIVVVDLDLIAIERADTASMSLALAVLPADNVTLTLTGDENCTIAPEIMEFSPTNWADAQILTITAIADGITEGAHSCTPGVQVLSADGEYDALELTLSDVSITDSLIDTIQEELVARLETDFRETLQEHSQRFQGYSKDALGRLKTGGWHAFHCGDQADGDPSFYLSLTETELQAQGAVEDEYFDCVTEERRISHAEFSLRSSSTGHLTGTASFAFLRERMDDEGKLQGRFFGGYLNRTPFAAEQDESILGAGVFAGFYGTRKYDNGLYSDHYIGIAAGHHQYDLTFRGAETISATGAYSYVGFFAGAAISGRHEAKSFSYEQRVGFDVALGLPTPVSVLTDNGLFTERGSVELPSLGNLQAYAEVDISPLKRGRDKHGNETDWLISPRLFCDLSYGSRFSQSCGFGAEVEWAKYYVGENREFHTGLDFEMTAQSRRVAIILESVRLFDRGNGKSTTSVGFSSKDDITVRQQIDWQF